LERVKDQEKRQEQENHNVGKGPTEDRTGVILILICQQLGIGYYA
jgi:hypothetical protein